MQGQKGLRSHPCLPKVPFQALDAHYFIDYTPETPLVYNP